MRNQNELENDQFSSKKLTQKQENILISLLKTKKNKEIISWIFDKWGIQVSSSLISRLRKKTGVFKINLFDSEFNRSHNKITQTLSLTQKELITKEAREI